MGYGSHMNMVGIGLRYPYGYGSSPEGVDNGGNVEEEAKDDVDGNMNVAVTAVDEDGQRLKYRFID